MGCAASREESSRKSSSKKHGAARKKAGAQTSSSAKAKAQQKASPTAKNGAKRQNPLRAPATKTSTASPDTADGKKFHALFAHNDAEKSSDLSSISDDNPSRVTGSQHTITAIASTAPSGSHAASPSNLTVPRVTKDGKKTKKRSSVATSAASNVAPSPSSPLNDEPKWKRQVIIKRHNLTKSREGPEGLSANKLARIQKWIDFSDQGTSPLGPLLSPQDVVGQAERDARLKEYVNQGIPLYAQANSSDPVTESERKRSLAPERKKMLALRVTARLKSRVANALQKAKRRQSRSFGPVGLNESGDTDDHPPPQDDNGGDGVDGGADGGSDGDGQTSDRLPTGSLLNVGADNPEVMSHAMLDIDGYIA